jgi:hypothetical protein
MDAPTFRDLRVRQRLDDEPWLVQRNKSGIRRIFTAANAAEILAERELRIALMQARAAAERPLFEE